MKLGVVATFARALPVLPTWIAALQQMGVSRFYLFADLLAEQAASVALAPLDARVFARDAALLERWQQMPTWEHAREYCQRQVYARQCLNVDVAIGLAREDALDWLLHIDLDELPFAETAGQKLSEALQKYSSFDQVTLVNHEAVPQRWHIENYFDEVNLFKRNPGSMNPAQQAQARHCFGDQYFYAYANGKSLMNLHGSCTKSYGAHQFTPASRTAIASEFSLLHYANCGFNWFYDKYLTLGHFDNDLLGSGDMPKNFPLMARGRETIMSRDIHGATGLYQQWLMNQGGLPASLASLLESGVLFYNRQPTFELI